MKTNLFLTLFLLLAHSASANEVSSCYSPSRIEQITNSRLNNAVLKDKTEIESAASSILGTFEDSFSGLIAENEDIELTLDTLRSSETTYEFLLVLSTQVANAKLNRSTQSVEANAFLRHELNNIIPDCPAGVVLNYLVND